MEEKIEQLKAQAAEAIQQAAGSLTELDEIRVKFLGKKGAFTSILRGMGALAKEDRPKIGKVVNEAKAQIEALIAEKNEELRQRALADKLASEKIDVTLPGRRQPLGHLHPLTLTLARIKDIFFRMGFFQFRSAQPAEGSSGARYAGLVLHHGGYPHALADVSCAGAHDAEE